MQSVAAWGAARVLCWGAGVIAILVLGANAGPHDPFGSTVPYGAFGDVVVGPFARWDSIWYLLIADQGYRAPAVTNFYPLYPLVVHVVGAAVGSLLAGGILTSLGGSLAATYLLERLASLELGTAEGRRTMLLFAFFPTAVFFSAVYAEGLFLPLSVGAIYAARRGHWAWAGVLGGLATMTRPPGLVLIVPIVLLYLYGPRADKPSATDGNGWRPRYRVGLDLLWVLAVPAGFGAFAVYLWLQIGDPLAMLGQRAIWHQELTFPLVAFARAAVEAGRGLLDIGHGRFPDNVYEFGFVCFAIVGTVGALRRLPVAYGAYAACALVLLLAYPTYGMHFSGFSRYAAALFPILMWLAAWTSERRLYRWVLLAFALLMVVNSIRFATWHYVA